METWVRSFSTRSSVTADSVKARCEGRAGDAPRRASAGRRAAALVVYLVVIAAVGAWMTSDPPVGARLTAAFGVTVALMHFWYDSFVWSVRRHQV